MIGDSQILAFARELGAKTERLSTVIYIKINENLIDKK